MAERWLTYQQAGEALGMSAEAVRQRARRLGWRTQPGNEGRTLVLLPDGTAVRPRVRLIVQTPEQAVQTAGQPPVQPAVQTGDANGLAEVLRGQLERERERADKAEGQAAAERARAERAETEAAEQRSRADLATGEVDGMKLGLEHMQEVLAQARREAAETGAKAEQMARAAKDANERLARLHSRGVWARLRNRP
jgi:hypothetical protein